MTIVNLIIEPEQRKVVTERRRAPFPDTQGRVSLYSLLTLCAVLTACGPSQNGEPEEVLAPTRAMASSAALELSPEVPVNPQALASASQYESAIAAGNGLYLVVWSETSAATSGRDILGVRVSGSDGTLLDASPLLIATGPTNESAPAVAFDGNNFLVVWQREAGLDAQLIYGTRVRASDGAVLDSPFLISKIPDGRYGAFDQEHPSVAFDGTNYLVVWDGISPRSSIYDYVSGVQGIRVRASDGTCVESTRFLIGSPFEDAGGFGARVAYTGGNYLVTWRADGSLAAVRVQAEGGQVVDPSPIIVSAGSLEAVTAGNGEFLVTWGGPRARRLESSSGALLGSADIIVGSDGVAPPEVTFDGVDYWILWQGYRVGSNGDGGLKFFATRVSAQGTVPADAEVELYNPGYSQFWVRGGIAAVAPGQVLTSYYKWDAATSTQRVYLRRLTEPQECDSEEPSLVLNGSAQLTLECGSGTYSDPGAQAFDGCGNPIAVHAYNSGQDSSGPGPNAGLEGTYSVSYSAWDANGRTVSATRTVIVDDRAAPTLTLNGAAHMTHTCGSQWVDPGVQATDACYGNLTPQVWRTGQVNGWAVGTYTVTYTLTDSGGNSATPLTRTVDVVNCPW